MTTPIALALIVSQPALRADLTQALAAARGIDVRASAASADGLGPRREPVDVALVHDHALDDPEADCRRLRPAVAAELAVFGCAPNLARLRAQLAGGARGFLVTEDDPRELVRAARALGRREAAMSPPLLRAWMEQAAEAEQRRRPAGPEPDLLALLAQGHSVAEIGRYLGIKPKTVRNRSTKLYRTLGARSRREAIRRAEELGYLDGEDAA